MIWGCVAAVAVLLFIIRIAKSLHLHHGHAAGRQRVISVASESEQLFVPGDTIHRGDYDYDDEYTI